MKAGAPGRLERTPRANERARELASSLGLPYVDLEEYAPSCGTLRKVPAELCCRLRCIPLVFNRRRIVLAVDDPFHAAYLSVNREMLGPPYRGPLAFAVASAADLDAALERRLRLVRD
jgi:hypothetical protein